MMKCENSQYVAKFVTDLPDDPRRAAFVDQLRMERGRKPFTWREVLLKEQPDHNKKARGHKG